MANDELKQHVAGFLRDYSIEITPHDAGKLDAIRAELPNDTAVYVAQIEDERIESAMREGDQYLQGTARVLKKHKGLWFNDESFVVSRKP
jgi:hypothetical protein